MRRRTTVFLVRSFDEACLVVQEQKASGDIIIDLENTLMPSGRRVEELAGSIEARLSCLADAQARGARIVATNRYLTDSEVDSIRGAVVVPDADKPRTARVSGKIGQPALVIGDELATDGRLARRLGVPFVLVDNGMHGLPWPSRLVQVLMRVVGRMLFRFIPAEASVD